MTVVIGEGAYLAAVAVVIGVTPPAEKQKQRANVASTAELVCILIF